MTAAPTPNPWQLARRADRMNPSVIREILKITERPGVLSLAGGLPSPDTFPVQAKRCSTRPAKASRRCANGSRRRWRRRA